MSRKILEPRTGDQSRMPAFDVVLWLIYIACAITMGVGFSPANKDLDHFQQGFGDIEKDWHPLLSGIGIFRGYMRLPMLPRIAFLSIGFVGFAILYRLLVLRHVDLREGPLLSVLCVPIAGVCLGGYLGTWYSRRIRSR